jgi:integrase/recombinase XerD
MCCIRAEHIDFNKSYLHVPGSNTKGGKARTVALVPEVLASLQAHLAGRDQGWILPSYAGDHLTPRRVQYILDSIAKKAGIDRRVHPHLLRHSHAVWALDSGISVYDLQKQLGHSSILTTAIYLESAPSHRRDAYIKSGLLSH